MRIRLSLAAVAVATVVVMAHLSAQGDGDKVVPDGGIHVPGWTGKIDDAAARQGHSVKDARFAQEGDALHVMTGPATTYWNPANIATGNYTVKATFLEPQYMQFNNHAHPYGIVIGGSNMGTDRMSLIYCVAYGDGTALVRGFGPAVFTLLQRAPFASVHKAAGKGQPVTQEIVWTVKDGRAECSVNGAVIVGYTKTELVADGKLQSTDGVYGLRFAHNTETTVTGFAMTKN